MFDRAAALAALAAGRPALVWRTLVADLETPVAAYLKLAVPGRGDFLLESVEGGRARGRYSILGLDPDLVWRADADGVAINAKWRTGRDAFVAAPGDTLSEFRALIASVRADVPASLPPALALVVGYFSYETIGLIERLPVPKPGGLGLPAMVFVRPGVLLVFDRLADTLTLVAPVYAGGTAALDAAEERLDLAEVALAGPLPPPVRAQLDTPAPTPCVDPAEYRAMVTAAHDYISAGDIFQVVLAQRFTASFPLPPFELYRSLRRINPSPFLYHLDLPGFAVTGSSPEILVRVRDGEVTVRPIAGTRPRGGDDASDAALAAGLLADPKERAEHLMLLDLGRNDVGRVATGGSVAVTAQFGIERYSHVMHMVSNVTGRLRADRDAVDALLSGFPAGTVSGAPKVRACEIIHELEPEPRGVYAGGVGYIGADGGLDSCIVLRTAVVKNGTMHVQAGAGIVADSDPAAEGRECEAKAAALFAAARDAVARAGAARIGQLRGESPPPKSRP